MADSSRFNKDHFNIREEVEQASHDLMNQVKSKQQLEGSSGALNKFKTMKTHESLPGNSPHSMKPLHNTFPHSTQRSEHHKLIELRHTSKSRIKPTMRGQSRTPASARLNESEPISQPADKDLAEVKALTNQLSSTQIDRSLSQMEINELQKYVTMHRMRNITILKLMLDYMTQRNELKAKILEQINTINKGVEMMEKIQNIIKQMGQTSTDFKNPLHFLEQLKNETLKLAIEKTQLMQKLIQCYQDKQNVGLVYMNAQNPEIDKKLKYAAFLVTTNKKLNKQVVRLKVSAAKLRLYIKQEELDRNEYDLVSAEENQKINVLKERIVILSNEIQKMKGETKGPIIDIMNVLKDYLYAESYRKSLAYQKRWLLSLLNNCQKRKGHDNQNNQRLLFKHKEDGLNSEGLWRAGGFAVVAVFRLQYLVKARTRSHLFEVKTLQQALMSS